MAEARKRKLNFYFGQVIDGKDTILTLSKAKLFHEAVQSQDDPSTCVTRLLSSSTGVAALQQSLRIDTTAGFINASACNLLQYLQDPRLAVICNGDYLRQITTYLVSPPIFWDAFVRTLEAGQLSPESTHAFAWLLFQLVSNSKQEAAPYIVVATRSAVQKTLIEASTSETRNLAQKINHIISTISTTDVAQAGGPGGRHDNDFKEFRNIAILPTADELASEEPPFLRLSQEIDEQPRISRLSVHLDNQFRLLREDMVRDLREGIKAALAPGKSQRKGQIIDSLQLTGLECDQRQGWTIVFKCAQGLPFLPKGHISKREKFLSDHKKIFPHGSLACLLVQGKVVGLGLISRKETEMAQNPPLLHLSLPLSDHAMRRTLCDIRGVSVQMMQLNTAAFSYEPVLKQLQNVRLLPLAEQILNWNAGDQVLEHESSNAAINNLAMLLRRDSSQELKSLLRLKKSTKLDIHQANSLAAGITQRFTLVQGPPGTGKSFIGALIAKSIYNLTKSKILVLSYTNHALDQCLEDFMDVGISNTEIVRLGSTSKSSDRTKPMILSAQKSSHKHTRADWAMINTRKQEALEVSTKLREAFQHFNVGSATKRELMEYLEFSAGDYYEHLQIPSQSEDGFHIVDSKSRTIHEHYLLDRWASGRDAGVLAAQITGDARRIWQISANDRKIIIKKWLGDIFDERLSHVVEYGDRFDQVLSEVNNLFAEKDRSVLNSKRVIGCTTTGAAKYVKQIQAAAPDVIIVEEAGEILESHILTAIGPDTKQIILIGDHKQLRPKAHYDLSVEKGTGYDLNRSLFERLVLKGYPHETLIEQHRMRPEISSLVRALTYPELKDATSTRARAPLKGFQSNVVFVNHSVPENDVKDAFDPREGGMTTSKNNLYEADMTLKCVRYLAQQGYGSDKVVVLTPYLGQLRLLFDVLSRENDPVLNDMDSYDLVRAGLMPQATANLQKRRLRISTIDNYQGEESDIIVASLTRSNAKGDIGFLYAPERLNVLISRARDGLILLGNTETFLVSRKGKDLWSKFLELLRAESRVFEGFPVRCEQHPDRRALLRRPEDFDNICPDGGCHQPCQAKLSCGLHVCPQKCHQLYDHSKMQCNHVMTDTCLSGHQMIWNCHQKRPNSCRVCDRKAQKEEADRIAGAKRKEEAALAQSIHDERMAEIEARIQVESSRLQSIRLDEQREVAYQQKMIDLQNAQTLISSNTKTSAKPVNDESATSTHPTTKTLIEHTKPENTVKTCGQPVRPDALPAADSIIPTMPTDAVSSTKRTDEELEWDKLKSIEGVSNDAMDALMGMTGLATVKAQFLKIYYKLCTAQRQGVDMTKERLGIVFLGNPGTGKTTVARHYAKFLWQLQILPGHGFVETTGAKLSNEGITGTRKLLEGLLSGGGGAFFIDEAYQLVSQNQYGGGGVLDFLLAEIETQVGRVVFIFAGYTKQMENFFKHNVGLESRIPHRLHFADYDEAELLIMLRRKIEKKFSGRMVIENGPAGLPIRIVVRRLHRRSGCEGFGNARDLENVLDRITSTQARRLTQERRNGLKPDDLFLTQQDIIGPKPSDVLQHNVAWQKLQNMIGLQSIKDSVQVLLDRIDQNYRLELQEQPLVQVSLNRLFLGSPGTGKTTVAKLYGEILADLGLLSSSEVILKTPADFVSNVLGGSEQNTKSILESTKGKVLVIDEAYMLGARSNDANSGPTSDPYRAAVIDTIVSEVQSTPGEDRAVLLLGYKDQMEEMLRNVNPGLSRRFPVSNAFVFEDYDDKELLAILEHKMRGQGLNASQNAKTVAVDVLAKIRRKPNFGNAGEVENLLSRAKDHWSSRQARLPIEERDTKITLEREDFDHDYARSINAVDTCRDLFKNDVGYADIVEKFCGYVQAASNAREMGLNPEDVIPFNFVFKGPPGTGKTTTARKIGRIYYDMGFLASDTVIECSATDLIGSYVGQTGPKVLAKMDQALGQVLFIDEAYRLGEGHFAKEAIDELVDNLTKTRYKGKMLVILAGYEEQINDLLQVNPGLSSRFPEEIMFQHLTPDSCFALLVSKLKGSRMKIDIAQTSPKAQSIKTIVLELTRLPAWGNGRDIETLTQRIVASAIQLRNFEVTATTILDQVIVLHRERKARAEQISQKVIKPSTGFPFAAEPLRVRQSSQNMHMAHAVRTADVQNSEKSQAPEPQAENSQEDCQRDLGVEDAVWQQLQTDRFKNENQEAAHQRALVEAGEIHQQSLEKTLKLEEELKKASDLAAGDDEARRRREQKRIEAVTARRKADEESDRLRKLQREAEERRKQEAMVQQRLQQMGVCVAGFRWIKQRDGYRCAGGSHFVDNSALDIN